MKFISSHSGRRRRTLFTLARMIDGKCLLRLLPLLLFPILLAAQTPSSASPPENSKAFSEGAAALQRGDLAAARAAFATAIRENPRNAKAANALGLVMLAQNDAASAIPQFQTALRVQPSFVNARINLSHALLQTHDIQGAVREARSSVRIAPNQPDAHEGARFPHGALDIVSLQQ